MTEVLLQRLDPVVPVPSYSHPGDAGADLTARVDVRLEPGQRALVATGIAVAMQPGIVGLVHPRSGLAVKHGIGMVNAPGTIDAGYRGEISVCLINLGQEPVEIAAGERIAQLVFQRVETARFVEVDRLPGTARGQNGFGSTGR